AVARPTNVLHVLRDDVGPQVEGVVAGASVWAIDDVRVHGDHDAAVAGWVAAHVRAGAATVAAAVPEAVVVALGDVGAGVCEQTKAHVAILDLEHAVDGRCGQALHAV